MNAVQKGLSHLRVVRDGDAGARAGLRSGDGQLLRRALVVVVGVPLALLVVAEGGWVLAAAAGALAAGGALEICRLAQRRAVRPFTLAACAVAAALPLIAAWRPEVQDAAPRMWVLALFLLMAAAIAAVWLRGPYRQPLEAVAVTLMAAVFTGGSLAFVVFLRHLPIRPDHYDGLARMALFPLVLAWITDTAAYVAGRAFGRRRMTRVSPGKTWEGAAAGLAACIAAGFAYGTMVLPPGTGFTGWLGAATGALVAAAGLAGDLAKSAWKREAGVKDSGRVFPGHGGVLDRLDSTFYALPIVYVAAVVAQVLLGWPHYAG